MIVFWSLNATNGKSQIKSEEFRIPKRTLEIYCPLKLSGQKFFKYFCG